MSQKIVISLTIILGLISTLNALPGDACQPSLNFTYYNMDALKNSSGWTLTYQEPLTLGSTDQYYISFCAPLNITEIGVILNNTNACSQVSSNATVVYVNNITTLNGTNLTCQEISAQSPTFAQLDKTNLTAGVVANLSDSNYNSNITITLVCGDNEWQQVNITGDEELGFSAVVSSKYACSVFSVGQIWQFMENYKYIFVPIFIILGFFICFFGLKMLDPTLFIVGAVASFFLIMFFFFAVFVNSSTTDTVKLVLLIIAIFPALAIGWLFVKLEKVGVFGLGVWLGIMGGLILWEAVIAQLHASEVIFYIFIVGLAILGGLATLWLYKDVVIIATALLGGYGIIRSASVLIGGYPNEFEVAQNIENGENPDIGWPVYVYLVFLVIFTASGIYFQFKTKNEEKNNEVDDEYKRNLPDAQLLL